MMQCERPIIVVFYTNISPNFVRTLISKKVKKTFRNCRKQGSGIPAIIKFRDQQHIRFLQLASEIVCNKGLIQPSFKRSAAPAELQAIL